MSAKYYEMMFLTGIIYVIFYFSPESSELLVRLIIFITLDYSGKQASYPAYTVLGSRSSA